MVFMPKLKAAMHRYAFAVFPAYVTPPPMGKRERKLGSIRKVHQLVSGSLPENAIEELAAIAVNNLKLENMENPVKAISYRGFQDGTDIPLKLLERYVQQICMYHHSTISRMTASDMDSIKRAVSVANNLQASIDRRKDPTIIRVVVFRFEIGKDIFNLLSIFQNDTPIHTYRTIQHYQRAS